MKSKKYYRNIDKYHEAKRRQQARHRQKYCATKKPDYWTCEELELLLNFQGFDRDLAKKLGRSLNAIYIKRHKLKATFSDIIEEK